MGDLSAHFSAREFRCRHCGLVVGPDRRLLEVLERIRGLTGRPLILISGTRCRTHNARVGGAPRSQHLLGTAADIRPGIVTGDQAVELGATGVGTTGTWATHVDVRRGPVTRWRY